MGESRPIPSNLLHLVMKEYPDPGCSWSLSGPQFPKSTQIQQRYCYPKGDAEYSRERGGALWTRQLDYDSEDYEFRVLHVYFSSKRSIKNDNNIMVKRQKEE